MSQAQTTMSPDLRSHLINRLVFEWVNLIPMSVTSESRERAMVTMLGASSELLLLLLLSAVFPFVNRMLRASEGCGTVRLTASQ
jgi:hypothetical protein